MKRIFFVFAICLSLVSSAQAIVGAPTNPVLEASLNQFTFDANHGSIDGSSVGTVTVNSAEKSIGLVLLKQCGCNHPEKMDAQGLDVVLDVKLPLITVGKDQCGTVQYEAIQNNITSGGNFQAIYVKDNTKNTCPHFIALPATEVKYITITPTQGSHTIEATSIFTGGPLVPGATNPGGNL